MAVQVLQVDAAGVVGCAKARRNGRRGAPANPDPRTMMDMRTTMVTLLLVIAIGLTGCAPSAWSGRVHSRWLVGTDGPYYKVAALSVESGPDLDVGPTPINLVDQDGRAILLSALGVDKGARIAVKGHAVTAYILSPDGSTILEGTRLGAASPLRAKVIRVVGSPRVVGGPQTQPAPSGT